MIKIKMMVFSGSIETDLQVENIEDLERMRMDYENSFQKFMGEGSGRASVWFTLETKEYSDLTYPKRGIKIERK